MSGATVPEWLTKRGVVLTPGLNAQTLYVEFAGSPQYRLDVRPLGGTFGCAVTQATNARRVDDGKATYPSADAALTGGLEQLRAALGW